VATAIGLRARGVAALDAEDLPNVGQALRSAIDDNEPELALTLGVALRAHWDSQGADPEWLSLLGRAADSAEQRDPVLPTACAMLSQLWLVAGDAAAARRMAERALLLSDQRPALRAAALVAWARVMADGERRGEGVVERLNEAIRLADGQPELLAQAASELGSFAARFEHDPARAVQCFERAAQLWQQAGRIREARLLRYYRALCLREMKRYDEALVQAALCERECEAIGERARGAAAINLQGVLLAEQRRWGDALAAYQRCVRLAFTHHLHYWLGFALWNQGRNLARLRQPVRAAQLMAFSEQHWTRHFGPLDASDRRFCRLVRRLVQAQLGRKRTEAAWSEGGELSLQQAVLLSLQP
jgi:tetratricopeptide (TPR) repeat protein